MKQNKVKIYARALAEAIAEPAFAKAKAGEEKKLIDRFLAVLVKNGLEKKAGQILDLAGDLLLKKQGKKKIIIESARKLGAGRKALVDIVAENGDVVKEKINPELIAGVKIIMDGERQFDSSLKNKLENIF